MKLRQVFALPMNVASAMSAWANRPLVLEGKSDFERITEYGLWRSVLVGAKGRNVFEGLTDTKHIAVFEGDKLNLDAKKDQTFAEFNMAVKSIVRGNRNVGRGTYTCFDERFPQKPSNTLLLIEGLEKTSPWLVDYIQQGGRVWQLPTFQDAAVELMREGTVNEDDIKNLHLAAASYQLQVSGLNQADPPFSVIDINDGFIHDVFEALEVEGEQKLRSHYFRDLMELEESKFQGDLGGSLDEAQDTYHLILSRANDMRSKKIKEASQDGAESLLILSDMDHRDSIISDPVYADMGFPSLTSRMLNGRPYAGHNLTTWFMPNYRFIDVVSGEAST